MGAIFGKTDSASDTKRSSGYNNSYGSNYGYNSSASNYSNRDIYTNTNQSSGYNSYGSSYGYQSSVNSLRVQSSRSATSTQVTSAYARERYPPQYYYEKDNSYENGSDDLYRRISAIQGTLSSSIQRPFKPERVIGKPQIFFSATNCAVTYDELDPYTDSDDYAKINRLITNKHRIKLQMLLKVDNKFLQGSYELKKHQKLKEYGYVEERYLFHGTKQANVDSICKHNFNWRFHGKNVGNRFGQGVSFSPNATYASSYSDENAMLKVMIVAKVMIGQSCIGNKFMELPPPGYDTAKKGDDGIVMVKFEDGEFCPEYIMYYHKIGQNNTPKKPSYRQVQRIAYFDFDDFYD